MIFFYKIHHPVPEAGKTVDPHVISDLEKRRVLDDSLRNCVSITSITPYLTNSMIYLKELWKALELKYKAHEEDTNNVIIAKLSPSWEKKFSKRMMKKSKDYSLDNMMKHLSIEEETHVRDKCGKFGSSMYYLLAKVYGHKGKCERHKKKEIGTKETELQETGEYKDHKSRPTTHEVEQATGIVQNVSLGEIFMISSLTQAISSRGCFLDTRAIVHCLHLLSIIIGDGRDGHKAELQGRHDVRLKFTHGNWVTLREFLHVPTISNELGFVDKFDKGGFKMELVNDITVMTKGKFYIRRANNYAKMYQFCLSDEVLRRMLSNMKEIQPILPNIMNNKDYRLLYDKSSVVVESRDEEFFKFPRDVENSNPIIAQKPMRSTRVRKEKNLRDDFYSYLVEGTQRKVTRVMMMIRPSLKPCHLEIPIYRRKPSMTKWIQLWETELRS
uniref:Uncharacterized protein n=1 Tax=Lactuca sativa TaxID=4236 RepID=A0A9R1VPS3_LACSA|nr:hypothetical protein LSAT_V11C400174680 [Lactuca sativa]